MAATLNDIQIMMRGVAPAVAEMMEEALAPLEARLADLEAKSLQPAEPKGPPPAERKSIEAPAARKPRLRITKQGPAGEVLEYLDEAGNRYASADGRSFALQRAEPPPEAEDPLAFLNRPDPWADPRPLDSEDTP